MGEKAVLLFQEASAEAEVEPPERELTEPELRRFRAAIPEQRHPQTRLVVRAGKADSPAEEAMPNTAVVEAAEVLPELGPTVEVPSMVRAGADVGARPIRERRELFARAELAEQVIVTQPEGELRGVKPLAQPGEMEPRAMTPRESLRGPEEAEGRRILARVTGVSVEPEETTGEAAVAVEALSQEPAEPEEPEAGGFASSSSIFD